MGSHFIPLGSGEVIPWEVHPSLSLLHQLRLFNFPIPKGMILLNPPSSDSGLSSDLVEQLQYELQAREFTSTLMIVCHLSGETFYREAWDSNQDQIGERFKEIFSYLSSHWNMSRLRADFLILENPVGFASGRAFSKKGAVDDWLEFQLGESTELLKPISIPIEKLAAGEPSIVGDFRGRIQQLLRSTRNALGEDNWVLNWKDNREQVFLTGISNYSEPKTLGDLYVSIVPWNQVPEPISPLHLSLILNCSRKLAQDYLRLIPDQKNERTFVIWNDHQLQFNFSFLSDLLRSFGLSTRALRVLPVIPHGAVAPFNGRRFWRQLPKLFKWVHDLSKTPQLVKRLSRKLESFETQAEKPFSQLFQEWQTVYVASSHLFFRVWNIFFLLDYFSLLFGRPPLRPDSFLSRPEQKTRWRFSPFDKFRANASATENQMKLSSRRALGKIEHAINLKALGWFSKGWLPSAEHIWSLTYEEICQRESQELS